MGVKAVVGLQWGDEGKGKIVDLLGESADVVVRAQGGDNAGHTVVVGEDVFKLHLLPSGAVREDLHVVIGNGAVVNPLTLNKEIDELEHRGLQILDRLHLSDRAHILLPLHRSLDALREDRRGKSSIGTTRRGIGPCYADKINRIGLRWHQARTIDALVDSVCERMSAVNRALRDQGGEEIDVRKMLEEIRPALERLQPCIADTVAYLHQALDRNEEILLEGAQGAMLDIDFGTYPFLTSSNTTAGGLCTGTGLPPGTLREVHGVLKAFTTRVGAGPFPTEQTDETGEHLRGTGANQWDEFGTTTGRPRRCGWLDLVVGRYAVRVNGVAHVHITKLDVLSQFDTLQICTGYRLDGELLESFPADLHDLERCEPEYETLPGWKTELGSCTSLQSLPQAAQDYVRCVGETLGTRIASVSFGPERQQTLLFD